MLTRSDIFAMWVALQPNIIWACLFGISIIPFKVMEIYDKTLYQNQN